jgi:hypothetical protein
MILADLGGVPLGVAVGPLICLGFTVILLQSFSNLYPNSWFSLMWSGSIDPIHHLLGFGRWLLRIWVAHQLVLQPVLRLASICLCFPNIDGMLY